MDNDFDNWNAADKTMMLEAASTIEGMGHKQTDNRGETYVIWKGCHVILLLQDWFCTKITILNQESFSWKMRPKVPHLSMHEFLFLYSTKSLRLNFVGSSLPKLADPCIKSTAHLLIVCSAMETNEALKSIFYCDCMQSHTFCLWGGTWKLLSFEGQNHCFLKVRHIHCWSTFGTKKRESEAR